MLAATIRYNLGSRLQELFDLRLAAGREDLAVLQRAADELDEVLGADHPHLTLVSGKRLGDIAWRLSLWREGEHAFRLAMAAAGQLAGLRRHRRDKERARTGVQGIGALAALCAARAGDIRAAAVHLEQASATLIAEAIGVTADSVTFDAIVAGAHRMDRHILLLGVTGGGGIAVLVGPNGATRHRELPDLAEDAVATPVRAFRQTALAAQTDPDADVHAAVDDLYRWTMAAVLTPLASLLTDVQRLAVLPTGTPGLAADHHYGRTARGRRTRPVRAGPVDPRDIDPPPWCTEHRAASGAGVGGHRASQQPHTRCSA